MRTKRDVFYHHRTIVAVILSLVFLVCPALPACASESEFQPDSIPSYSGQLVVDVNYGEPFFTDEEKTAVPFETYSELDALGRCGTAYALITRETMPDEKRGDISSVRPSGWNQAFYNDEHAYERCHLIAFMLAGENDNPRNLITGTHRLNVDGMLPYEAQVAQYVDQFNGSVLYRVTPVFEGDNLVAKGVLMEAYAIEWPEECCFNVFVYNQPYDNTFQIDYLTGNTSANNQKKIFSENDQKHTLFEDSESGNVGEIRDFVLNMNSKKIHLPTCESVSQMSEKNRQEYTGTIEELEAQGYTRCKSCNP